MNYSSILSSTCVVGEKERKKEFSDMSDEELALLARYDIDKYRSQCFWECPKCGYIITYIDSLLAEKELYVHDMICKNYVKRKSSGKFCHSKMILNKKDGIKFYSPYFDAIFHRVSSQILSEAKIANISESKEEIYSALLSTFTKVVGMFARNEKYEKISDKWFRSYTVRAMRNKISDIGKMGNYQKRTPLTKCEICGKKVGQIDPNHLLKKGHNIILESVIIKLGRDILKSSGEIIYYNDDEGSIIKRSLFLGGLNYYSRTKTDRTKLFRSESMDIYHSMFPSSYFKNKLMSTNEPVSKDLEGEVENIINLDSVFNGGGDLIEDINLKDLIDIIMKTIFSKSKKILNNYFFGLVSADRKIEIIKEILLEKCMCPSIANEELDTRFGVIKKGLTQKIVNSIKKDTECRMLLYETINKPEKKEKSPCLGELF